MNTGPLKFGPIICWSIVFISVPCSDELGWCAFIRYRTQRECTRGCRALGRFLGVFVRFHSTDPQFTGHSKNNFQLLQTFFTYLSVQ